MAGIRFTAGSDSLREHVADRDAKRFGEGLPLSVQVVVRSGRDEAALAVAVVLERECGGWRMAMRE